MLSSAWTEVELDAQSSKSVAYSTGLRLWPRRPEFRWARLPATHKNKTVKSLSRNFACLNYTLKLSALNTNTFIARRNSWHILLPATRGAPFSLHCLFWFILILKIPEETFIQLIHEAWSSSDSGVNVHTCLWAQHQVLLLPFLILVLERWSLKAKKEASATRISTHFPQSDKTQCCTCLSFSLRFLMWTEEGEE